MLPCPWIKTQRKLQISNQCVNIRVSVCHSLATGSIFPLQSPIRWCHLLREYPISAHSTPLQPRQSMHCTDDAISLLGRYKSDLQEYRLLLLMFQFPPVVEAWPFVLYHMMCVEATHDLQKKCVLLQKLVLWSFHPWQWSQTIMRHFCTRERQLSEQCCCRMWNPFKMFHHFCVLASSISLQLAIWDAPKVLVWTARTEQQCRKIRSPGSSFTTS